MSKLLSLFAILALTSFAQSGNPKNQSGTLRAQKPELVLQTRHSSDVLSVAFSPDGKTLASGSNDNTVRLWEVSTGTELRTLKGHSDSVLSVAFSPDGRTLASGSKDKTVKLWDVSTGTELHTLEDVDGYDVLSVAFSPDGKTLASPGGSLGRKVYLWEVSTGTYLRELEVEEGSTFESVAFSPDGKTLATSAEDGVKLWEVSSGTVLRTLEGNYLALGEVAFSPDGKTLAASARDGVKLWEVSSGTELRTLVGQYDQGFASVAFSSDGKTLASGGWDKALTLWDVSAGKKLRTLKAAVTSVAFSPDGKTLASGSADASVKLWEASTGTVLLTLEGHSVSVNSVAFSSDGKTLAGGSFDSTVKLWDVSTGPELRTLKGHSDSVSSVTFSPDAKTIASGGWDKTVKLWDVSTGTELRTLRGHSNGVTSVAFSPDGKTLASGSADATVKLWDVSTGTLLRPLGDSDWVNSVAFSPDGKTLAAAIKEISMNERKTLWKLWEVSTGAEVRTVKTLRSEETKAVAFSSEGKTLASANREILWDHSWDYTVKLWDISTGTELRALKGHSDSVNSVAFSPDGKILASGSMDCTVKLWNVSTKKELRTLKGHSFGVVSLAFGQGNKYLVSGSWDGTVKVWDVSTGTELASLIAFDENDWMVVTPDGLFDGSPAAWTKIIWRFNNNTFNYAPVEAFYNEFYYPGLLTDIFAGKRPKAPSDIAQKDRRQPQLKLTLNSGQSVASSAERNATVKIDISQAPAGAQDVRLFRNGSLVRVWRGDVLQGKSSVTLETTIPIVAGENRLTAYAFNHDNVKSSDVTLTVTGAESLKRRGTLHILAIGVSQYANRDYNLDYTTDDATSFASQLKLQQEKLAQYQSVEIKTLLSESATKENILSELKQLAATVQPEDGVVVYFSGHGKASGDHFYLVPHDLGYSGARDQLSEEGLRQVLTHSISDVELEEAFRGIDAGQMFMIIDACNSGQALENKDEPRRGPMNARGLAQLAYEKGMYIMTASQSVEEAFVSEKLKHSYLTYAMVEEGLKTKAADPDHNGEVNLREWFDYAVARVPKLREETLQGKSLEEVTPAVSAVRSQKSQTPRVFYRREPDARPLIVAKL